MFKVWILLLFVIEDKFFSELNKLNRFETKVAEFVYKSLRDISKQDWAISDIVFGSEI